MTAYRGLSQYNGRAELSTWLWSIAYRQGINYLRKNRNRRQLLAQQDGQLPKGKNTQAVRALESEEQAELVWQIVGRLPELWALTIILFYREGKTVAEIAKIMKKRKNTIKTYLFRGRRILKELLADCIQTYTCKTHYLQ